MTYLRSWNFNHLHAEERSKYYRETKRPDGSMLREYEIFADGFAGKTKSPDGAVHRPCGLAQGPDGSLFISDDKGGSIWKVTYNGAK